MSNGREVNEVDASDGADEIGLDERRRMKMMVMVQK